MKDKYGSLGTISVEFSRERKLGKYEGSSTFSAAGLRAVPEKALKVCTWAARHVVVFVR